jgi:hypothetical protein
MFNWDQLFNGTPGVLTVVGMAKNVGKTVTLNYVQKRLYGQGLVLGLTSIGRDGERFDALTNLAKPSIIVPPGTIVATAEKLIRKSDELEFLQATGILTPLGEILILRAHTFVQVVLAGPSKNQEIKQLLRYLSAWGTDCILIDGAFDRQSPADPLVSNQVILATGATVSRDLNEVICMTKFRVEQLTLPESDSSYRQIFNRSQAKVISQNNEEVREISIDTPLLNSRQWLDLLGADYSVLMVKGAIGDGLALALLEKQRPAMVIVQDGSKIFITPPVWQQLKAKNIEFQAIQPINLLGLTINPTYPGGRGFEPDALLQGIGRALEPLPVIDVVRGIKF